MTVLQSLGILNRDPIPLLDLLCDYAVSHFGVSTAAITLMDRENIVFKSVAGKIHPQEVDRNASFCTQSSRPRRRSL